MRENFTTLLRLRFDERNRGLIQRFTEEKQRLNARGLLHSAETVKAMHNVVEKELKESAGAVVATAVDVFSKQDLFLSNKRLQDFCSEALLKRKDEIEALYLSQVRDIEQALQNKAMIRPYMSLGKFYSLQREEMLINLSSAYEKYRRDRGGNLAGVLKNKFLNRPIIAWATIAMAVIVLLAAFAGAIGSLWSLLS